MSLRSVQGCLGDKDIPCPEKEPFAGAEFISSEQIVLWTELGRVRVYSLRGPQLASEQIDVDVSTLSTDVRTCLNQSSSVSEFNIRLGYRPTVTILRSNELQYVLCLRNASVGLEYSLARLPCGDNDEQAPHIYESHIQWDFNSAGPILKPSISCSMMLTDVLIALGDSHVWIISVDQALLALTLTLESLPSEEIMILRGHVGAITTIFTSDDLMQRSFLMSGGEDCSARIWSIDSGAEIACFNNHSRPIAHFLQVPDDVNSRIRRSVISVAQDCSIAIISIEEMSCIYLFGGYEHALLSIQWRPSEDYIVLWYADATAFIWQMQTGHLDRTVRGDSAREIIMDPRWKNCDIVHTRSNSSKLAFDCITTWLSGTAPARVAEQQDYIAVPNLASQPSNTADVKTPARRGMLIGQWRSSTKSKAKAVDQPVTRSDDIQKCLDAAKRILSLMITEDNAHAISIRNSLGLSQPVRSAAFGMRGAYGNISIQAPAHNCDTTSWCISPTMTASKLITILSLTKIVVSVCNLSVDMDIWPKDYCSAVQDSIGANYCPPSLSYLAKYWQDPQMEIQEAARIILLSTIERMSKAEISSLVKYWSVYLPAAALPDTCSSQYMARSAIILGIIGAENADALPETVRKLVALSLTILLNDDTRLSYRIASIDLLSQGFGSWQPFIRADAVLHTLFTMAMDSQSYNTLVSRRARRAIARIAAINPTLFVTTLTQDILDVKKQADRAGLLKLVSIFSRKNPAVLYKGIPRLTEAIVKSLDPIAPQARESLLPVATSVMMDLVHSFPQLDFHTGSQKLAVGTLEGAIVVYDLHTATRWQILEGHSKSVSAVSFSRDGETIVSCSIKERSVRFWHPSPGFFGMLMGGNSLWAQVKSTSVGGSKQSHSMTSLSSQQSSRKIDFALEDSRAAGSEESMLNHVRFEWTGDKAVKLSVYDHVMSLNI
ncbi:hypothetical protein BX616_007985 [Lobosporangium transversale]|nr:hypothetical protein BX616_007985 [Lobosporangium transversale]